MKTPPSHRVSRGVMALLVVAGVAALGWIGVEQRVAPRTASAALGISKWSRAHLAKADQKTPLAPLTPLAQAEARAMRDLLDGLMRTRSNVVSAIGSVRQCRGVKAAAGTLKAGAAQRQIAYDHADHLVVVDLPRGRELLSRLRSLIKYSYQADDAYAKWARGLIKHCSVKTATRGADYRLATSRSGRADQAKIDFTILWNSAVATPMGWPAAAPTRI